MQLLTIAAVVLAVSVTCLDALVIREATKCPPFHCPFVLCSDNQTLQTLTCVYDTTFPSTPLVWTVGDGLNVVTTTWNIARYTNKTVFDYSSLSPGYHKFAVSYQPEEHSSLEEACTCPHCLCAYTTVLEVKDKESKLVSQAFIKLSGPSSQLRLNIASKRRICFEKLTQSMSSILKDIDGSATRQIAC